MQDFKTFPNAPIIEAIFDIQVRLPENIGIDDLERIHEEVFKRFPAKEKKYLLQAELKAPSKDEFESGSTQVTNKTDTLGFMFRSDTGKKIFQARTDGFTFNKLKPYEDWETFFAEAQELWNIYKKIACPTEITRIALRYINKINIPLPLKSFDDYLFTAPQLPGELPQGLAGFFMQYSIRNDEIGATAMITQTIEPQTNDNKLPYVFDIDVFKENNFDDNDSSFWTNFAELRDYKNQIFFNCLTSKAKELFE